MSDQPEATSDAITAEDTTYAAIVSEFRGLRRNGAGMIEAALLTGAHLVVLNAAAEG